MAKDKTNQVSNDETNNEETTEKRSRRKQSVSTQLKFTLNNLLVKTTAAFASFPGLDEFLGEDVANGIDILKQNEFELRESTADTALKLKNAMQSVNFVTDDLAPNKMTELGKLLRKAQRGELVTDEDIYEIVGNDVNIYGDEEAVEEAIDEVVESFTEVVESEVAETQE